MFKKKHKSVSSCLDMFPPSESMLQERDRGSFLRLFKRKWRNCERRERGFLHVRIEDRRTVHSIESCSTRSCNSGSLQTLWLWDGLLILKPSDGILVLTNWFIMDHWPYYYVFVARNWRWLRPMFCFRHNWSHHLKEEPKSCKQKHVSFNFYFGVITIWSMLC